MTSKYLSHRPRQSQRHRPVNHRASLALSLSFLQHHCVNKHERLCQFTMSTAILIGFTYLFMNGPIYYGAGEHQKPIQLNLLMLLLALSATSGNHHPSSVTHWRGTTERVADWPKCNRRVATRQKRRQQPLRTATEPENNLDRYQY